MFILSLSIHGTRKWISPSYSHTGGGPLGAIPGPLLGAFSLFDRAFAKGDRAFAKGELVKAFTRKDLKGRLLGPTGYSASEQPTRC